MPIVGAIPVLNALSTWFWRNRINSALAVVPLSLAAGILLPRTESVRLEFTRASHTACGRSC